MVELCLHCPLCLHGIALNLLSIGTTLPFLPCWYIFIIRYTFRFEVAVIRLVVSAQSPEFVSILQ
jgi:hypothetical protein